MIYGTFTGRRLPLQGEFGLSIRIQLGTESPIRVGTTRSVASQFVQRFPDDGRGEVKGPRAIVRAGVSRKQSAIAEGTYHHDPDVAVHHDVAARDCALDSQ